jgi:excisionase family DNA binding protein
MWLSERLGQADTAGWHEELDEHGIHPGARARSAVKASGPESTIQPMLLTLEEAALVLRIGRTRMYALVGAGTVRSVRIGSSRRVPVVAIEEYVARLLREGGRPEDGPNRDRRALPSGRVPRSSSAVARLEER